MALGALAAVAAAPAWAQKSPTAKAALLRAVTDLGAQHFAEAAAEMETAVRFEPRFAFGWYLLASSQRRAGNCDRAVAAYRRYAELRPSHPDPHFGMGLCLELIGDRNAALASFRRYVATDTRTEWAEFIGQAKDRIAKLEHQPPAPPADDGPAGKGNDGRANPPAAKAHEKAAQLIATHNYPEAANDLRTGIKDAPADATAWYKLAFALRESNQPEEAAKAYRRYITLRPEDPDPYYGLGHVLLASGHPDEALTAFRAYVKLAPANSEHRWVSKARAEIAHLESARRASGGAGAPSDTKPGATTPPPADGTTAAALTPPATAPSAPPPASPPSPPAMAPSATTATLTPSAPKTEP